MQMPVDFPAMFDTDAFSRTRTLLEAKASPLPEPALRLLAIEVVQRLAAKSIDRRLRQVMPTRDQIVDLCNALVSEDESAAARIIFQARAEGATVGTVYLGYITGAARQLGDWWDEDRVPFDRVTVAAGRMFGIIRGLRQVLADLPQDDHRRALFATVPGEQHALGVAIAADIFRREGWEIDLRMGEDHDTLVAQFETGNYPIVGLSIGREESMVPLARLIVALHISNPNTLILVSGGVAERDAEILLVIGADAVAPDAVTALTEMERLAALVLARRKG